MLNDRRDADQVLLGEIFDLVRVHVPHVNNRDFLDDREDEEEFHTGTQLSSLFDEALP